MKTLSLFILVLFSLLLHSQAPTYSWAKTCTSSAIWGSYPMDIETDNSGNVIVVGSFDFVTDFDPGIGVVSYTAVGSSTYTLPKGDAFVAKYDGSGNLLWAFPLGNASDDVTLSAEVDASGNIYVAGYFHYAV